MFGTVISATLHAHNVQLQRDACLAAIYAEWIAEDILRAQETQAGWARAGPSRADGRARNARQGPHASRWRFGARQRRHRFGGHGNDTEIRSAQASCSTLMLCCEPWGDAQMDHCERRGDTGVAQTSGVRGQDCVAFERSQEQQPSKQEHQPSKQDHQNSKHEHQTSKPQHQRSMQQHQTSK